MANYLIVGGNKTEREKEIKKVYQKIKSGDLEKDTEVVILQVGVGMVGIGIDQIRNLKHRLSLKSANPPKVAIIPESQNLTVEAQTALSKFLEEPPGETVIILANPNLSQLLPIVTSRCQIINLPPISEISLSKEEIKLYQEEFEKILKMSPGERIKFCERFKNREEIEQFCQIQLFLWRGILLKNPNLETSKIIRQIQKTHKYLKANTNPRLTLENLLFSYPPDIPIIMH